MFEIRSKTLGNNHDYSQVSPNILADLVIFMIGMFGLSLYFLFLYQLYASVSIYMDKLKRSPSADTIDNSDNSEQNLAEEVDGGCDTSDVDSTSELAQSVDLVANIKFDESNQSDHFDETDESGESGESDGSDDVAVTSSRMIDPEESVSAQACVIGVNKNYPGHDDKLVTETRRTFGPYIKIKMHKTSVSHEILNIETSVTDDYFNILGHTVYIENVVKHKPATITIFPNNYKFEATIVSDASWAIILQYIGGVWKYSFDHNYPTRTLRRSFPKDYNSEIFITSEKKKFMPMKISNINNTLVLSADKLTTDSTTSDSQFKKGNTINYTIKCEENKLVVSTQKNIKKYAPAGTPWANRQNVTRSKFSETETLARLDRLRTQVGMSMFTDISPGLFMLKRTLSDIISTVDMTPRIKQEIDQMVLEMQGDGPFNPFLTETKVEKPAELDASYNAMEEHVRQSSHSAPSIISAVDVKEKDKNSTTSIEIISNEFPSSLADSPVNIVVTPDVVQKKTNEVMARMARIFDITPEIIKASSDGLELDTSRVDKNNVKLDGFDLDTTGRYDTKTTSRTDSNSMKLDGFELDTSGRMTQTATNNPESIKREQALDDCEIDTSKISQNSLPRSGDYLGKFSMILGAEHGMNLDTRTAKN